MYARQITSEENNNIIKAKQIIEAGQKEERKRIIYYAKQRFLGLLSIGVSITMPLLLNGDCTISLITFPAGLYLIFTRKRVTY